MQTIHFGDEGQQATREIVARFEKGAPSWEPLLGSERIAGLRAQLATLDRIDRQHGGHGPLPLEGASDVLASLLTDLAQLQADLRDADANEDLASLVIGVALWAIRHEVPIAVVEPVVNALAHRSNRAGTRQELAAAFGLMQGVIRHVSPELRADLERSNPERPWRLLHLNLAITAIRTEDPEMMAFAFDSLEAALPDERAGFFAEALALALGPRVAPEVRNQIEARHLKWTAQA